MTNYSSPTLFDKKPQEKQIFSKNTTNLSFSFTVYIL